MSSHIPAAPTDGATARHHAPSMLAASFAWSPNHTVSPEFLYMVGGLLIAVALLLFTLHRRQSKADVSLTPLEDPAHIAHVFQQCAAHRSRLSITCSRNKLSSTQMAGTLLPPPEKNLVAPLTLALVEVHNLEEWTAAPVDVYFHFTQGEEKTFYHFSSFVQNLERKQGQWLLTLARPSVLTNNQRREFVRVQPPTDMVEAITAWPLSASPLLTLPVHAQELGRPPFAYRPPRVILLEMMDISAGGMRMRLPVEQIRQKQVRCAPGTRFVVLLALDALRPDQSRQLLWLASVVRRAALTQDKSHADLGLQFTHWAPAAALTDPMEWQPVESEGEVPFLLRWVSRVNAHLARMVG